MLPAASQYFRRGGAVRSSASRLLTAGCGEGAYARACRGVGARTRFGPIEERFGIRYHNHHVPRLLHQLGFSVQRPRTRLARADHEAQALWLNKTLPALKKK